MSGLAPAMASMSPEDQQRVRNAVADKGPGIYASPMVGGSRDNVARYLAEGELGALLAGRHTWQAVWNAAAEVIAEDPSIVERSPHQVKADAEARRARVDELVDQAEQAFKADDLAAAGRLLDEAYAVDPDHRLPGIGGVRSLGMPLSQIRDHVNGRLAEVHR